MNAPVPLALLAVCASLPAPADENNLVSNGSFERIREGAGAPEDWSASGARTVRQTLRPDTGRDGGRCGRLECTEFSGDGPDVHAMICQTGRVGVRGGRWYRLRFWARAENLKAGSVEAALVDTRGWSNAGLAEAFTPGTRWQPFEFRFRARADVPAASSRLQFWFTSTGTLWLDDVELIETEEEGQAWFPQIPAEGVKNLVPNASFECGTAGWGSFTWGLKGWGGNLYRLEGEADASTAVHGRHSLRLRLAPGTLPVFWFDYYEPVRQPVRRVLAANLGWFRVRPGETLTLSAFLRADAPGTTAQLAAVEAPARRLNRAVPVGTEWERHQFTFTPAQPHVFIAVGLDLEAAPREAATLWIDAVQLERGGQATAFEPRRPVEAFLETDVPGHTFTDPERGLSFMVRAYNETPQERTLRGKLVLTDFFDRPVHESEPELRIPPRSGARLPLDGLARGRRGFFRAAWTAEGETHSLRGALLDAPVTEAPDSLFGFNHAYPWDFLVRLAGQAGVPWWRDWSAKWHAVEPEPGRFDFQVPDAQIRRVRDLGGEVLILLPFPSAAWSTTAIPEEVAKAAGTDSHLRARLPMAWAPKDPADFGRYAAETVRHYHRPRPPTHFQILNEPLYTDYALPRRFGHTLEDYLRLLEAAARAMKAAHPDCRIVGGIGAGPEAALTRQFVEQGGMRFADVLDLHMYDPPRPASAYENSFRALEELLRAHGGPKPIWITEWGCYADDDPPCVPHTVGDATMNRCRWPSEQAAAEHIVKFAAVGLAHGVRRIFFHAGTCGTINGPDAGGVLFEYGGAPRKMLPAVSAFTRRVGVPEACVKAVARDGLRAYLFRAAGGRTVAVAWREDGRTVPLSPRGAVRAFDVMGNALEEKEATLGESPVYLEGPTAEAVAGTLERAP